MFSLIFPGQGSQSPGMLAELGRADPIVGETYAEAGTVLGYDLWQLVQEGPRERLDRTEYTQPALLAGEVALWRLWQKRSGPAPTYVAGHSLGEYAALVCAGSLQFTEAVAAVAERGRLMQEAVRKEGGAMAAVLGLEDGQVERICQEQAAGEVLEPANYNCPGQVVIAGTVEAVQRAADAIGKETTGRVVVLPISVPAHCTLMQSAASRFSNTINLLRIKPPSISVIRAEDGALHETPDSIRFALLRQLYRPVRWSNAVRKLAGLGTGTLIELGPGRVLSGLCRRIERGLQALPTADPPALERALQAARSAISP